MNGLTGSRAAGPIRTLQRQSGLACLSLKTGSTGTTSGWANQPEVSDWTTYAYVARVSNVTGISVTPAASPRGGNAASDGHDSALHAGVSDTSRDPAEVARIAYEQWSAIAADDPGGASPMDWFQWQIRAVEEFLVCLKYGRGELAQTLKQEGRTWPEVAAAAGVADRTVRGWVELNQQTPDPRISP